jgi:hypothetical protein
MLPAVEAALTQLASELPDTEAKEIRQCAVEVTSALMSKETARLKEALAALDNATQTLATRLIERAMQ